MCKEGGGGAFMWRRGRGGVDGGEKKKTRMMWPRGGATKEGGGKDGGKWV